jgi:hypothetical protein
MGSAGIAAISSLYRIYHQYKRNSVVFDDWGKNTLWDPNYDGPAPPLEKILEKPVPAHCRRILFKDEYNRTRSKVICGNAQDPSGQRVYYNN